MRSSTPGHWARYWKEREDAIEEVYPNEDRILRQLEALPLRGRPVLEVGAGSGRDSLELAARGARVHLLDYVQTSFPVVRRQARERGLGLLCVCADARQMPFRDRSFALVFHQGLMEHFRDPRPLLEENARVLEHEGHLLVDVPQRYHVYTLAKHILIALGIWFAGWETEYSPGELERLVRKAGLRVVRTDGAWFRPGFFYRGARYLLRKLRLARLPLYPQVPGWLDAVPRWIRGRLEGTRLGLHTCAMISVLARRERPR